MVEESLYEVPDIVPGEGFIIEMVDGERKPIANARLKASVDGGERKPVKSDKDGIIKVNKGPDTRSITLYSMEG